jgi:RecB family exonuclease
MPRKIHVGPFQPVLEAALAEEISARRKSGDPLAPLSIVVPTRLLGLYLQRALARRLANGHVNLRFRVLEDLLPAARQAPRLGLELLCDQIARDEIPANGHFAPVRETRGFRNALLETFKDLEQAGVSPESFRQAAAKSRRLSELSAAYTAYRSWLAAHGFVTESDLYQSADVSQADSETFLYGFYDLTAVQKQFVSKLSPTTVFFPWTGHNAYAEPLLDWFKSQRYEMVSHAGVAGDTPNTKTDTKIISAPGETSEVHEAVREALAFVATENHSFNDVAILCRSREQYDAILRDTLGNLGVKAYFRGGRPQSEQPDARLLSLLLEMVRSDFSRASVMELACHTGPHSHWDALSVQLGIVGGQQQWLERLEAASSTSAGEGHHPEPRYHDAGQALAFVKKLVSLLGGLPEEARWNEYCAPLITAFRALGGRSEGVVDCVGALAGLEEFQERIAFETFADYCWRAVEASFEQPQQFQAGGIFVGDVMSGRGLSWPLVILLGLVEKVFPRMIREDPLLPDAERARISAALPHKLDGGEEERLLFSLTTGAARDRLVLSYPRLEPSTWRPRIASFLLLEYAGANNYKTLDQRATRVPLSPVRLAAEPLNDREFDLGGLLSVADKHRYLQHVSALLAEGVGNTGLRWRERALTAYDGVFGGGDARELLRHQYGLEKLVISATSLEDFYACPFYYFQKHVLGVERWEEPEAAFSIDALDLGSLYHAILEDYYQGAARQEPRPPKTSESRAGDVAAVAERYFDEFQRRGVTGYPTVWEVKKQIVLEELRAFVERDRAASVGWVPTEFEKEFRGITVAPPVRLRGKIDRIDRSDDGARARILDYKTGRLPRSVHDDSLAGGEALQLPLYILAAEELLPKVRIESASYLYFTMRGGYRTITFTRQALDSQRPVLTRLLNTAAGMIREGLFGQYASADGCRQCDYRPICGNGILKLYERKRDDPRMETFRSIKENVP